MTYQQLFLAFLQGRTVAYATDERKVVRIKPFRFQPPYHIRP